jgi:hypothetical protein
MQQPYSMGGPTKSFSLKGVNKRLQDIEEAMKDIAEFQLYACRMFELIFNKLGIAYTEEDKYESKRTDN